ncbi:hypothetical protein [Pseudoxanthomonas sp.]|uniref:hypothetical protein n=1 Tax=Pseudoxanthomonas sp. TaxID=1871049 RepID=UPI0025EF77E0|nr:hypothetical protein [Pseudoxanthomonas sp.]
MKSTLTFESKEDEGAIELRVRISVGDFSGSGCAWFSRSQLEKFIAALAQYPLSEGDLPRLSGGYWDAKEEKVAQEHVGIIIEPCSKLGALRLSVFVAEPSTENPEDPTRFSCSARLSVNYSHLDDVSKGFSELISGDRDLYAFHLAE